MMLLLNTRYQRLVRTFVFALIAASIAGCETSGIDFSFKPLKTNRNADGSYLAEVEVSKHDDWRWDEINIRGEIVTPTHNKVNARLVSDLPSDPVPERFVLTFRTDKIDGDESVDLRVRIKVRASKNAGLSGASRSMSELVVLEPQNVAAETDNTGKEEDG